MSLEKEEIHNCIENIYTDAEIRYEKINIEQWSWVLEQIWVASHSDVSDGTASNVGEIISTHTVLILYCPFCGGNLTMLKSSKRPK